MNKFFATIATILLSLSFVGCSSDASVARNNLTKAADNFELMRRIIFYNARLGSNVVTVEGRCSIEYGSARSEYVCKIGEGQFVRNFVTTSNDVVVIVEQMDPVPVNVYHFRRTFKPQALVPDVDFRGSSGELLNAVTPDRRD